MSKHVDLDALAEQLGNFGFAYLMTVGDNGRVHAVAVHPVLADGVLVISEPSHRTHANALARPGISLVWPPAAASDYSLIVDGDAVLDGDIVRVAPIRAVLHRAAVADPALVMVGASDPDAGCRADCIEI
jgi:hypothetical protein